MSYPEGSYRIRRILEGGALGDPDYFLKLADLNDYMATCHRDDESAVSIDVKVEGVWMPYDREKIT